MTLLRSLVLAALGDVVLVALVGACSGPTSTTPANVMPEGGPSRDGSADAPDATDATTAGDGEAADRTADSTCDASDTCSQGSLFVGAMRIFELTGTIAGATGPQLAKELDAAATFRLPSHHDYDDDQAGLGCQADHYDASANPEPPDADAGWLRMSGFVGGTLLSGERASQPILCLRDAGHYRCSYPSGAPVAGEYFAGTDAPLGEGPITFAFNGGVDFGPRSITGSPVGTVVVDEDLSAIRYDATTDTVLHVSCPDACTSGLIAVDLIARPPFASEAGVPSPPDGGETDASFGVVHCRFRPAPTVTIPHAAVAAMLASDETLGSIAASVALVPSATEMTTDAKGNRLTVEVGRGVFGLRALP